MGKLQQFPALLSVASRYVATPLVGMTAIQYGMRVMHRPAAEVYGLTITGLGVTAALAAVCLSSTVKKERTQAVLLYAGEKFLHATLLLLQMLFLIFAREGLLGTWPVQGVGWAEWLVRNTANLVGLWVVIAAALSWKWALEELNDQLWVNWRDQLLVFDPLLVRPLPATVPPAAEPPPPEKPPADAK